MRLLLFHNTLAEYRIKWFFSISNLCEVKFVFTNDTEYEKKYNNKIDREASEKLDCVFLNSGKKGFKQLKEILSYVNSYDFVLYPPVDTLHELLMSRMIKKACKRSLVKTGYFWEKWEAPIELQPTNRIIKNKILGYAAKSIYYDTDIVFAGGSKSKEYFMKHGIKKERITILPDSSETPDCEYENIKEKYGIPAERRVILYFGRILEQKGLDILIKAFSKIEDDSLWLLVAGDGPFRAECERLADELNISFITFAGHISPKVRKNFFSQCDLFVFPGTFRRGRTDVWGLTLNEAIEAGKPVISTDAVGSAYDLIENGSNGYRIKPENVDALRDVISRTLTLNKLLVEETNKSKMQIHNFENMAQMLVNTASQTVSGGLDG